MTDLWQGRHVGYFDIDGAEIAKDGSLRLYRGWRIPGVVRRQAVFHPRGEWASFRMTSGHTCDVELLPPTPRPLESM